AAARAILAAASDPSARRQTDEAARYLSRQRTAAHCLEPLLKWAAAPQPASDLHQYRSGAATPSSLLELACDASRAFVRGREEARRLAQLEYLVARWKGSRLVRLALRLRGRRHARHDFPADL